MTAWLISLACTGLFAGAFAGLRLLAKPDEEAEVEADEFPDEAATQDLDRGKY